MSEKLSMGSNIEWKKQDEGNPVYKPIIHLAKKVYGEVMEADLSGNNKDLVNEYHAFCRSLSEEKRNYRLCHYLIGSTPPDNASIFDSEGEGSLAKGIDMLAKKYGITVLETESTT